MYDYNFPEQLTQERLTLLLLSIVIPTDTSILQDIYKKKKELEIIEYNKGIQDISEQNGWILDGFKNVSRQIQALFPGFIMYNIQDADAFASPVAIATEEIITKTHPLTERDVWTGIGGRSSYCCSPLGVDIINYVFEKWYHHNNRFTNDKYKIIYNHSKTYRDFSKRLEDFKRCADLLDNFDLVEYTWPNEHNLVFETIEELNNEIGIQVNQYGDIVC